MTNRGGQAPGGRPAAEAGELADQIVGVVTKCPSVAGLAQVRGMPVATYLPGRTVSGVAIRAEEVEVCVVARFGKPLPQVTAEIRRAVAPLVPGRVVDVVIADITAPEERPEAAAPSAPALASAAGAVRSTKSTKSTNSKREESVHG